MRRHEAQPDAVVAALAGRVQNLEERLDALRREVDGGASGLAELSRQVRTLALTTSGRALTPQKPAPGSATGPGDRDDAAEPLDWARVDDPEVAAAALYQVEAFATTVLDRLGRGTRAACWPFHPLAVAELLALAAQHAAAYTSPNPTDVSEWMSRWLPGAYERIREELAPCDRDRGHRRTHCYAVPAQLDLAAVARWWTDTHGNDPDEIEAFALTRIY